MHATYTVEQFIYTPRHDGENGNIRDYELYFSNDPARWGDPTVTGQFERGSTPSVIDIPDTPRARYFKLVALSEAAGRAWTSAAELGITASSKE
jgi:beta-galactosidase